MNETQMQHGIEWDGHDLAGWFSSEKFNGCRAYWDGATLWSRGGIAIQLPDAWRVALPVGIPLDGEIYDGQDGLTRCTSAVRYGRFTDTMRLMVFDAPDAIGEWPDRMRQVGTALRGNTVASAVGYWRVTSTAAAFDDLDVLLGLGGEGLMLRHPTLPYRPGRTVALLKMTAWTRHLYRAGADHRLTGESRESAPPNSFHH